MKRQVLLVMVSHRHDAAVQVQKVLTGWGCTIKTRLGLHEGVMDNCSESGLLFLELAGETEKHEELDRKLNLLTGVKAQLITLELDD